MYLFTVAMMWKEQARSIKSRNRAVKRMGARQAGNTATIPESGKDLALPSLPWPPLQGRRGEGLGDILLHPIFALLFARKSRSQLSKFWLILLFGALAKGHKVLPGSIESFFL